MYCLVIGIDDSYSIKTRCRHYDNLSIAMINFRLNKKWFEKDNISGFVDLYDMEGLIKHYETRD